MSALGGANGNDGPGGVALLGNDTFDVIGAWELDRGEQYLADDVCWHLNYDTVITSEWGTPSMFAAEGWSSASTWATNTRSCSSCVRPTTAKAWGFVGTTISVEDLSASVWLWHQDGDRAWDDIFYPDGGGLTVDPRCLPNEGDFRGLRVHQTRLQGGDASSDSRCFTS
jgi:selenium-binding protein 1